MNLSSAPTLLACALLSIAVATQEDREPGLRKLRADLAALEALRSLPVSGDVTVNGRPLAAAQLNRQILERLGAQILKDRIVDAFVEAEQERQKAAGADPQLFAVPEAPKDDPHATQWRRHRRIERVLLRGSPSEWPEVTKQAIEAAGGAQGGAFFANMQQSAQGKPVPQQWLDICRQWLVKHALAQPEARRAADLDARATAEVLAELNANRPREAVLETVLAIVLESALRHDLESRGFWLSDEQHAAAFAEYRKPFDGTPFTTEVLATSFKGYPSLAVYEQRWRLMSAFERSIDKEIDGALPAFEDARRPFYFGGQVSARVLRLPDPQSADAAARRRARLQAERLAAEIQGGRLDFDAAAAQHAVWPKGAKHGGKLTGKSLNALRTELGENEYRDLASGPSLAELLFFHAKPGQLTGPWLGADGYYIVEVTERSVPPGAGVGGDVRGAFVIQRFVAWAHEVAGRTAVK